MSRTSLNTPEQMTIGEILRSTLDPSARKSRGNEQSAEAHAKVLHSKAETYRRILAFIDSSGPSTVHQIAEGLGFGKAINRVSGRLSELKMMNPPKLRKCGIHNGAALLERVR